MKEIDLAKRRRVMQRSQQLGHCICEPRRPCPCDVFTDHGACPCAGERPATSTGPIKLMELVRNAGCASKIAAADLEAVLSRLPTVDDPSVLSGLAAGDDAGVYRLTDGLSVVQTVDLFTPCVDDAYTFGRICAANCLSDIYAMGAVPRTALSILCFPSDKLDNNVMYQMLKGAMDCLAEAKVALIGGHSIKDDEIKLGFAVTGTVEDGSAVSHGTARVGDVLVLTKPLGVGVLNFCRQIGRTGGDYTAMERSMASLNKSAAEAMCEVVVSACTDVTGFGLFGHLISMARHSGVTVEVFAKNLPAFGGAVEALRNGVIPGASERNREYVADDITVAGGVDEAMVNLGFDAQTSGGLLILVSREKHASLLAALSARGVSGWTIGSVTGNSGGRIVVTANTDRPALAPAPEEHQAKTPVIEAQKNAPCCCESAMTAKKPSADLAAHATQAFGSLMNITAGAGIVDARTKQLINFALAILTRCGPCFTSHLKKARQMGITREELQEVAWCAVAMGGAPVKMFYQSALEDAGGAKGCS